ncbi:MAG: OmpA family protein [Nitrospiria bacterium]
MKSKKPTIIGTALLGVLICAASALAETELEWSPWYVGVGAGFSELDPETGGTSRVGDSSDVGIKLFGGYDFTERLTLEGYYSRLGKAEIRTPNGDIKYRSFGASILYYFYKQEVSHAGWGAFGRLGLGRMKNRSNLPFERDNDHHILFGAGLEYGFRNGFALRADVDFYDEDARLIGFYLLKRFGGRKTKMESGLPMLAALDHDGDGVRDSLDLCLNTDMGVDVDVDGKGCALDSDGDAVLDSVDACPNSAAGSVVNEKGCERDEDADGIVNSLDHCPNTGPDEKVDESGCQLKEVIVLEGVTFATDSAELISHSQQALNRVRNILNRHPELKIEIAGHADERGSRRYNLNLSQRRAEEVRNYLIGQGISASRMIAKGYGFDKPISDNALVQGRAANRRVEMHILK